MELEWLLRSTFFGINTSEEAAAATTTRDEMITRSEEQQQHEESNRQRYYKRWRRRQPRYLLIFVALLLLLQNNVRLAEGATATTTSLLLLPITDNESARENRSTTSVAADVAAAASGESLFVSSALPKLAFRSRDFSSNNETTTTTTTSASSSNSNVDSRSEFTDWSDWSVCDRNCMQNRIKKCRAPSQCANSLLREERVCTDEDKTGSSCRGQKNSARRKKKRREYHIVQVNDEVRAARKGSRRKHHHHNQHHRRKGKNELLQDDDGGGGHRTPQDEYGKWSKWSSCTRSCTTQRLKWCKIPGLCAKDVVRQTAYCYIEGSYCQRWIRRKIHQHYEGNGNAASGSDTSNLTEDRFADLAGDDGGSSSSSSSNSNLTPVTTASEDYSNSSPAWKCGVARKSNKLSYFTRIIGGRPTLPGSWPWQVAVLNRYGEAFCGGTLVSPRWVLTAAHCVRKRLSVRIGEYNLLIKEGTEIELKIDHSVTHPKYNAHTVDNDIALLRLPVSLTPSETRGVACLPAPWQELPDDQLCTIIGWGKTNATHTFGTDVLHEARIPIVPDDMCRDVYVDYKITNNMFCAGYRRGRMDSCAGDSGGPLLCRNPARAEHPWTIFGITSFGEGCGKRGKYGIYAKLSNYVHWINKVVRKDSFR